MGSFSLKERKVSVPALKEGYFARFKAWARRKPTPWQQSKINDLVHNLVVSLGEDSGDSTATLYNSKGFRANKHTREHRAGLILVELGLAEVKTNKNHQLEFIYRRPQDLKQQIMGAELLFESIPVHLTAAGNLDWNRVYSEVPPQKINDLRIAGLCPFNRMEEAGRALTIDSSPSPLTYPEKPWQTPNEAGRFWADRVKLLASEAPEEFQEKLNTLSQVFGHFYDGRNPTPDVLENMALQMDATDPFISAELRLAAEDYNRFFSHLPAWQRRSAGS